MCLLVLAWNSHSRYRLIVAANRDEFHERPAAPLGWWQDEPRILGGRDLRGAGTWMAVARSGRFGIVTNFRDLEHASAPDAPSRGELVPQYLAGATSPLAFLDELRGRAARYAGFNLLLGDRRTLHYYSNRNGDESRELSAGIYGLSNHWLDTPWPKLARTRTRFSELVQRDSVEPGSLFDLLGDRAPADDDSMPATGLPPDWERALSAPFVAHERYGTRCSTLLLLERNGRGAMHERRFDATGALTGATRYAFGAIAASDGRADSEDETTANARLPNHTFDTPPE